MQQNCYLHRIIVSMYAVSRELPLAHFYFGFLSVCAKLRRAFRFQPPTIERAGELKTSTRKGEREKGGWSNDSVVTSVRAKARPVRRPNLEWTPVSRQRVEEDLQKVILIARYKGDNPRGSSPARAICNDQYGRAVRSLVFQAMAPGIFRSPNNPGVAREKLAGYPPWFI